MKKIIILMVCLWGLGNTFTSAQTTEKEKFISSLMKQMAVVMMYSRLPIT
jgi:beta-glucosidase